VKARGLLCVVLVTLLLFGCAQPTATPTPTPRPTATPGPAFTPTARLMPWPTPRPTATPEPTARPAPTPFVPGKVDIGGRSLYCRCSGQGAPTVVVEAGFGEAGSSFHLYDTVMNGVAGKTRICVYDRAPLGLSDQVPAPRTSQDVANDLHALLVKAGINAPYVLVGFSFGGVHARVYRALYPQEVTGMVLVDAMHPDSWTRLLSALPPASAGESGSLTAYRDAVAKLWADSAGSNSDGIDIPTSAAQARDAGSLGDLPLVVVTHSPAWKDPSVPVEVQAMDEQLWQDLQIELAALSSNGSLIAARQAGHWVHVSESQLVIDAILNVVEQARKRGG